MITEISCKQRGSWPGGRGSSCSGRVLGAIFALLLLIGCASLKGDENTESITNLVEKLRHPDFEVYRTALTQFQMVGVAAVPELINVLESKNEQFYCGAVEALVGIGKPAVPLLIQAAKAGRLVGVEGLSELGPQAVDAIPALAEWLKDQPSMEWTREVTRALAEIGKPAVPILVAGLKHTNEEVRAECLNKLGWIGADARDAVPDIVAMLKANPESLSRGAHVLRRIRYDSRVLDAQMLTQLESPDPVWRQCAVTVLQAALKPQPEIIDRVVTVAKNDPDAHVRAVALNSLATLAPEDVNCARFLVSAMANEHDSELIHTAGTVLSWMPSAKQVVPELTDLLKHSSPEKRGMAAYVLGLLGGEAKSAIPAIIALLRDADPNVPVQATMALEWLGPLAKEAAPEVAAILANPRAMVFGPANALKHMANPSPAVVDRLMTRLKVEVAKEQAAKQSLKPNELPRPRYSVPMSEIASLIEALGACGTEAQRALPLITSHVNDSDPLVRAAVVLALMNLNTNTSEVLALARSSLKDSDRMVKLRAVEALGRVRPSPTNDLPLLIEGLSNADGAFRIACLRMIGQWGGETAKSALLAALRVRLVDIRIEAAGALLKRWPGNEPAWRALLAELRNHWSGMRELAVEKIAELPPEPSRTLAPLRTLLNDSLDRVRAKAAQALGQLGPAASEAVPELQQACLDPDPNTRHEAAQALKKIVPAPNASAP